MRIVVLGTRGFPNIPGGIETHCENLYPCLAKRGCEIIVLGRAPYTGAAAYSFEGVRVEPLPAFKNKYLESFLHTLRGIFAARHLHPDILHIHGIGPGFFIPLARILGFKVILTTHSENYHHLKWGYFARLFLRASEFIAVFAAHRVIAISSGLAKAIREKYRKEVMMIPNGVKLAKCVSTLSWLQRYGLESRKYVMAVGRFVPEKGFHDLLEAYERSGLTHAGWKLVIVGDADHEDAYNRSLKERAGQIPGVLLTGRLVGTPLHELFSQAGLFILPSYYEGLPIVLLEALGHGLNCVVSDILATQELLGDKNRFFKPGDIEVMSCKLAEFSCKPLSPDQILSEIDFVTSMFNWENIADKTKRVCGIFNKECQRKKVYCG